MNEGSPNRTHAMDRIRGDARLDARMLDPTKDVTSEQRAAIIRDLVAYRDRNRIDKKPISWAKLGGYIGVTSSVLSEIVKGTYQGDTDRIIRLIDQFLASEEQQGKRPQIRDFVRIRITEYIVSAINETLKRRSIGVITGEPGSGKSKHAEWFCDSHDGAVLITADDTDGDAKFVIDKLHEVLKLGTFVTSTRQKKREIEAYLKSHLNTVILVDESQKLTNDALEILRALHDKSDPDGRRNVPVILFGDDKFYKIIVGSRGGVRTPLSPQITSRMYPVLSLDSQCLEHDGDGQPVPNSVYSREDIERIVRQQRLKLVRSDAIAWAVRLANLCERGRLRIAARVIEIAIDIKRGNQVTVDDLESALELFVPADYQAIMEEMKTSARQSRAIAAVG